MIGDLSAVYSAALQTVQLQAQRTRDELAAAREERDLFRRELASLLGVSNSSQAVREALESKRVGLEGLLDEVAARAGVQSTPPEAASPTPVHGLWGNTGACDGAACDGRHDGKCEADVNFWRERARTLEQLRSLDAARLRYAVGMLTDLERAFVKAREFLDEENARF